MCVTCTQTGVQNVKQSLYFTGARVRRLIMHPKDLPWIVSALQWNNEVSMWDVETGARQKSLWASTEPPLSQSQVTVYHEISFSFAFYSFSLSISCFKL